MAGYGGYGGYYDYDIYYDYDHHSFYYPLEVCGITLALELTKYSKLLSIKYATIVFI